MIRYTIGSGYFIPSFYGMVDEIASMLTKINKDVLLKEFKSIHQSYGSVLNILLRH